MFQTIPKTTIRNTVGAEGTVGAFVWYHALDCNHWKLHCDLDRIR